MIQRTACVFALAAGLLVASSAEAVVKPPDSPVREKAFRHPDLDVRSPVQPLSSLQPATAAALEQELAALGVTREYGFYDVRAGRWGSLILSEPLIPGTEIEGVVIVPHPYIEDGFESLVNADGRTELQLLTVVPVTAAEIAYAEEHGPDALYEQWEEQETDLLDVTRTSAV